MKVLHHPIIRLPGQDVLEPSETGTKAWRYAVSFRNADGEIIILVTLSEDERRGALAQRAPCGGPTGLVAAGYILRRAYRPSRCGLHFAAGLPNRPARLRAGYQRS
jgi:hypothetical protein